MASNPIQIPTIRPVAEVEPALILSLLPGDSVVFAAVGFAAGLELPAELVGVVLIFVLEVSADELETLEAGLLPSLVVNTVVGSELTKTAVFLVVKIGEDDTLSVVVVSFTFVLAVAVVAVLAFVVEVEKDVEDFSVVFFNVVLDADVEVVEIGEDDTLSVVVVSFTSVLPVAVVAVLAFVVDVEAGTLVVDVEACVVHGTLVCVQFVICVL